MTSLTDRYVTAVTSALPATQREEIARELPPDGARDWGVLNAAVFAVVLGLFLLWDSIDAFRRAGRR